MTAQQLTHADLEGMSPEQIMSAAAAGHLEVLQGRPAPEVVPEAPDLRFEGTADQGTQSIPDETAVPLTRADLENMTLEDIAAADTAGRFTQLRTGTDPAPHQIDAARTISRNAH